MTLLMTDQPLLKGQWDEVLQNMLDSWPKEHRMYCAVSDAYTSLIKPRPCVRKFETSLPYHALDNCPLLDSAYKTKVDNGRVFARF